MEGGLGGNLREFDISRRRGLARLGGGREGGREGKSPAKRGWEGRERGREGRDVPLEARRRPQRTMGRQVIATRGTWATSMSLVEREGGREEGVGVRILKN